MIWLTFLFFGISNTANKSRNNKHNFGACVCVSGSVHSVESWTSSQNDQRPLTLPHRPSCSPLSPQTSSVMTSTPPPEGHIHMNFHQHETSRHTSLHHLPSVSVCLSPSLCLSLFLSLCLSLCLSLSLVVPQIRVHHWPCSSFVV